MRGRQKSDSMFPFVLLHRAWTKSYWEKGEEKRSDRRSTNVGKQGRKLGLGGRKVLKEKEVTGYV